VGIERQLESSVAGRVGRFPTRARHAAARVGSCHVAGCAVGMRRGNTGSRQALTGMTARRSRFRRRLRSVRCPRAALGDIM
jgi:hypothetical protein